MIHVSCVLLEFGDVANGGGRDTGGRDDIVGPQLILRSSANMLSNVSKYSQVLRPLPVLLFLFLMSRCVFRILRILRSNISILIVIPTSLNF